MPLSFDKGRQVPLWVRLIGSFSDDDGDGNENVKKTIRFIEQNNKFARASRFFLHFFAVTAPLRRENAQFHVLWRT